MKIGIFNGNLLLLGHIGRLHTISGDIYATQPYSLMYKIPFYGVENFLSLAKLFDL